MAVQRSPTDQWEHIGLLWKGLKDTRRQRLSLRGFSIFVRVRLVFVKEHNGNIKATKCRHGLKRKKEEHINDTKFDGNDVKLLRN